MYSDPELDALLVGPVLVVLREYLLHCHGALDGIDGAGELSQNTITCRIGDPPAVLSDKSVHDLAMSSQGPERPDFILLHEARIASHVSREDGCQPPLDPVLLRTHRIPRCNFR
jgi:hypothetical protein